MIYAHSLHSNQHGLMVPHSRPWRAATLSEKMAIAGRSKGVTSPM